LTAVRLLTLHNLTFMQTLMTRLRGAIEAGDYEAESARILSPSAP
jgi:queuine/archaeosine tRNA-ribosyltransferase